MALEYRTLKFTNDARGLNEKDETLAIWTSRGWRVAAESIEPGHMKGGQICCFASVCLPLGGLAGRTSGYIVVTMAREMVPQAYAPGSVQPNRTQSARAIQSRIVGPTTWGPAAGRVLAKSVNWCRRNPVWLVFIIFILGILSLVVRQIK
jgi:hypothetical protein